MSGAQRLRTGVRLGLQRVLYIAIGAAGLASHRRYVRASSGGVDAGQGAPVEVYPGMRVLLVRLDLLGDLLFALPLAEALKSANPETHVTFLTSSYAAELAALSDGVDEVIPIDVASLHSVRRLLDPRVWLGYMRVIRRMNADRFDLAISVYGRLGSLCAALSRARCTVGYVREAYPNVLSHPIAGGRHLDRKSEAEYVQVLASSVGLRSIPEHASLHVPAEATTRAVDKLAGLGITDSDRVVAIHAGSTNGSAKRWPARYWGAFAREVGRQTGARLVLVGAPGDRDVARAVIDAAGGSVCSLAGETDIAELAGVIGRADLVATGDSGPLHLAVALGRPVLGVYGPTDPAIYGPYRPKAPVAIHRRDLPCSPCYSLASIAECPLGDPICMRLVSVDSMVASAVRLLAAGH